MTAAARIDGSRAGVTPASNGQFLAVVNDAITRETVKTAALQMGWQNPKVREGGAEAALKLIQGAAVPGFLLVDISDSDDPLLAMSALAEFCGGETHVLVIGMLNDVGLYRRLVDMGVSDYLIKPVSSQAVMTAIQTATRDEPRAAVRPTAARHVALIGARGGVGTTTIALSVAWILSQQQQQVVLVDLDLHFGSLALSLDIEPSRGFREILGSPDRIDSLLIGAAMTNAGDRLRLLGAEEPLEDTLNLGNDGLATLLTDLATSVDCIVVDLPRSLVPMTRHVLGVADAIGIVTDLSLPAMRDTQRLIGLIKGIRDNARLFVIVNRMGGVAGEVSRADFERGIGAKIAYAIPFDAKAAMAAAERAKPFVEVARQPKTVSELHGLAVGLVGAEDKSVSPPTLLQRIMGK